MIVVKVMAISIGGFQIGGLSKGVEISQGGSFTKGATPSRFYIILYLAETTKLN